MLFVFALLTNNKLANAEIQSLARQSGKGSSGFGSLTFSLFGFEFVSDFSEIVSQPSG